MLLKTAESVILSGVEGVVAAFVTCAMHEVKPAVPVVRLCSP
ncbi:MAG: hypothetical protein ACE5K8_04180 [Candidatus Zixiibacteriota bacterium]